MKIKLLKKLREAGRNKIKILSITTENGITIGMKTAYNEKEYSGLFDLGDTEEDVKKKAERIYIKIYLKTIKSKS